MNATDLIEFARRLHEEDLRRFDSIVSLCSALWAPLGIAIAMVGFLWTGLVGPGATAVPPLLALWLLALATIFCIAAIGLTMAIVWARRLRLYEDGRPADQIAGEFDVDPWMPADWRASKAMQVEYLLRKVAHTHFENWAHNRRIIEEVGVRRHRLVVCVFAALILAALAALVVLAPGFHKAVLGAELCYSKSTMPLWRWFLSGC